MQSPRKTWNSAELAPLLLLLGLEVVVEVVVVGQGNKKRR